MQREKLGCAYKNKCALYYLINVLYYKKPCPCLPPRLVRRPKTSFPPSLSPPSPDIQLLQRGSRELRGVGGVGGGGSSLRDLEWEKLERGRRKFLPFAAITMSGHARKEMEDYSLGKFFVEMFKEVYYTVYPFSSLLSSQKTIWVKDA